MHFYYSSQDQLNSITQKVADLIYEMEVSPLIGVIFEKLSSPLLREFGSLWGARKDLEKLSETTSTIRLVLEDAEIKQIHDAPIRDWLRKLKEIAYEADDVFDDCIAEALFSQDSEVNSQVCDSFSNSFDFKRIKLRSKITKRIKEVREKFDGIAVERKFHEWETDYTHHRETTAVVLEDFVYGRDEDKEKIVTILLNNASSGNNLSVYSIVGMGGLGKTTLAQCVYKDTNIENNFPARIWVCVSIVFRADKIIKTIIECVSGEKCELEDLDALQSQLKVLLTGKKFLLVLDDVWNEDQGKWDELKFSLEGVKGSCSVLVTTRLPDVAHMMDADRVYQLAPLSNEDCWLLIKRRAFRSDVDDADNDSLQEIGKQIVEKCGGLPFVAKALGSLLLDTRDLNKWMSIRDGNLWELEDSLGILSSSKLSYDRLPPHLRSCFAYCSIFPKDHEIDIGGLIHLWIANDLVYCAEGDTEGLGWQIFNQLERKSFFLEVGKNWLGNKSCKMPDIMHNLACSVARNQCVALEIAEQVITTPETVQHVLVSRDAQSSGVVKTISKSLPHLRTFLFPPIFPPMYTPPLPIIFENFTSLRALFLRATNIPMSIAKMKHLRYLNLSFSVDLQHLPESICSLNYLQTLELSECSKLQTLPKPINKLTCLSHLYLSDCRSLTELPDEIGGLINLRHLDLSECGSLIRLPDAIGKLQSLRHLDLHDCVSLCQLPDAVEELSDLQYLDIRKCVILNGLPNGIGKLSKLRELILNRFFELPDSLLKKFTSHSESGLSITYSHI